MGDALEPKGLVQPEGRRIVGIHIADHLPEAGGGAGIDELAEQCPPDAAAEMIVAHVDRVLHRVAIGGPLAEQHHIGIADHPPVDDGDEMG